MRDALTGHVLLMDDEPALLRLMSMYLSRVGYTVEACEAGNDAWTRFQTAPEKYDLVIADLTMPDFDVEAMLPKFVELRPEVRVLVCSGRVFDRAVLPRDIRGNFSVLQKPFVPKMLADAVKDALRGAKARAAVA